jgi:cysteinyl-tRNA synthetase
MDEDFNTALAISVLFELATEVNRSKSPALARQLKGLGGVLGLLQSPPRDFLQGRSVAISPEASSLKLVGHAPDVVVGLDEQVIEAMIRERTAAKKAKNFAEADRIRAELLAKGIVLEDSAAGTKWRRQ